jgi:putative copper resistance protein D
VPLVEPLVLIRALHLTATVLASGTAAFMVLVATPMPNAILRRQLIRLVWAALATAVLSGLAWLTMVAANILDLSPLDVWQGGAIWPVIADTRFGQVACLRLVVAGVLALLLLLPSASRGLRAGQLAAAAMFAGSLAPIGHAGAAPDAAGWLLLASDILHLLAASAWLGGLPALALLLARSRYGAGANAGSEAVITTARFSRLGMVCVGTLVGSGLFNSWQLLTGPGDLLETTYGRVLSCKVGLFLTMVAVAAYNRYRLTPRLPAPGALASLQRNSLIEAALGFGVLILVGALGTMIPGGHRHINEAPVGTEAAFVHIHTEAAMADVTIDPGRLGRNTAVIRLSSEDYSTFPARAVRLRLAPRDGGGPTIERAAEASADGAWTIADFSVPKEGVWVVFVLIDNGQDPPIILDGPIVFAQCSNECW